MPQEERYYLKWIIDSLGVGSAPMNRADLESLSRQGIDAIMNLCDEYCDLHWVESDAGFDVYYLPIIDEKAPDMEALEKALDWLDEVIFLGKKALIHCKHGIGRTGTVLNAYLLRKGYTPRQISKLLKGVRAKPANFEQWWFVRSYGKKQAPSPVRDERLEAEHTVDLTPFFMEFEQIAEDVESRLYSSGVEVFCGAEHQRCCENLVTVSFVEAAYITSTMNSVLTRPLRRMAIERARDSSRELRRAERAAGGPEAADELRRAWRDKKLLCPFNEYGCTLYDFRPLACQMYDLRDSDRIDVSARAMQRADEVSARLFEAYTGRIAPDDVLFYLQDVISGKFVEQFFRYLWDTSCELPRKHPAVK